MTILQRLHRGPRGYRLDTSSLADAGFVLDRDTGRWLLDTDQVKVRSVEVSASAVAVEYWLRGDAQDELHLLLVSPAPGIATYRLDTRLNPEGESA